jgi:hypothetical protein
MKVQNLKAGDLKNWSYKENPDFLPLKSEPLKKISNLIRN